MSKRVLLTGHAGFVGSHTLIHLLLNTDWEVIGIDSFRHKGVTDRVREVLFESHPEFIYRFKSYRHDLTVPISPVLAQEIGKIDYIINMASESHVDRSIESPRVFIENNVNLVLTMLEYAREYPVEKFLQVSTDEVYGSAPEGHLHREGEPHKPSNPYSASKSAQEDICYSYWRTYSLPICISNTMNIIGEMQDSEKYVPMVVKKIHNGKKVSIHASPDGKTIGSRFYLHARNQADALLYLLSNVDFPRYGATVKGYSELQAEGLANSDSEETPEPETVYQSDIAHYHVVGEREVNNLELAQIIADASGKELDYELVDFHSSRAGHDLRYALDGAKLKQAGWVPPIPFEDSLRKTVEWTLENPKWLEL